MNKPQIKNFSVWARRKLIETVSYRMSLIGIFENRIAEALPQSTADLKFYDIGTGKPAEVKGNDIKYRNELVSKIERGGYKNTVEEIAYTWFNRLIAIRFMEVNDYLPSRVRVLSSLDSGKNEPDIVTEAVSVAEENGFDITADEIYRLKDGNKADELFGKMFEFQCIQLYDCLPELFQKSANYMEMLLPVSYTDKDGIIYHLVHDIPEDDFNLEKEGQVEIIGWLYQYYNTEPKDAVFAALKKNVKISKENIPAATQLFTPDWIVRYMVENSLGRLWLDGHSDCSAKSEWKYYLEEAEQEESVRAQLDEIRKEYRALNPEQIKFIDPCMGSGHILIYAFDVLMQIYMSCGYSERDAAQLIIQKNLYGLDIDKRAYQLAYFSLMMKARQYDRRFLTREIKPNLAHFQGLASVQNAYVTGAIKEFAEQFENCDTYGSLTEMHEIKGLDEALDDFSGVIDMDFSTTERMMTIYKALTQKYDVVCTNPPYMGGSGMNSVLSEYVKKNFEDYKSDLFSASIVRCTQLAKPEGYLAFLSPYVWMFIQSYEKLRNYFYTSKTIETLIQFEYSAFEEATVPICTFILKNSKVNKKGVYLRLTDFRGGMEVQRQKTLEAIADHNCGFYYETNSENFSKIPGAPVAYWVSENFMRLLAPCSTICDISKPCIGMRTGDNDRFLRMWYEISFEKMSDRCKSSEEVINNGYKWIPYNKGGSFRRWYGNNEYVVNWENNGFEIKEATRAKYGENIGWKISNEKYYFFPGITWGAITSSVTSFRYYYYGYIFSNSGQSVIMNNTKDIFYLLGFLNTKIVKEILKVISPTIGCESGYIAKLPFTKDIYNERAKSLSEQNIDLCKSDWDSFETSWDFKKHPLLNYGISIYSGLGNGDNMPTFFFAVERTSSSFKIEEKDVPKAYTIESAFEMWNDVCNDRFNTLKQNEEELNRIFIDIYGLQDELTPEVEDKDVTVRKADLQREIKSLVSYAVGCMFGRYSLDVDGLAYAGGEWDDTKYRSYIPDKDNCIPITDDYYFEDDIIKRFTDFVKVVYGEETLEENLNFIAEALGNKGKTSREVIRNYFLNDFYKEHLKIYQKRPIYWLFDSGKQNGFKALVYMHRWNADTIGNVRVEYLHKTQKIYMNELDRMQDTIDNSNDSREIAAAKKAKEKLTKQLKETKDYDASMAHLANMRIDIDLDDGVKVNYEKVQTDSEGKNLGILAKI